jgi:cobalt/nickel transport system permease protein
VVCYYCFGHLVQCQKRIALPAAFACGFFGILLGAVVAGAALMFTEENFLEVTILLITAHIPVMLIEGVMTAFCVAFLRKVQPDMLPHCKPASPPVACNGRSIT